MHLKQGEKNNGKVNLPDAENELGDLLEGLSFCGDATLPAALASGNSSRDLEVRWHKWQNKKCTSPTISLPPPPLLCKAIIAYAGWRGGYFW